MNKPQTDRFESVWDAMADTPGPAGNHCVRSELMELIAANGWTQIAAAEQCGVTQPRISDLLRRRISRFSLDVLVNIATALRQRVHVELEAA